MWYVVFIKKQTFQAFAKNLLKIQIVFRSSFRYNCFHDQQCKVITIIHFIAKLRDIIVKPNYNFRNWKYVTFKVRYSSNLNAKENDISSNFECEITFDDRAYFLKNVFKLKIKKMIFFISIRNVKNKVVNTNEYVMMIVYINDVINDIIKTVCFTMKMHFANDLKVNILFETNIITPQRMIMNLKTRIVKLEKYQEL